MLGFATREDRWPKWMAHPGLYRLRVFRWLHDRRFGECRNCPHTDDWQVLHRTPSMRMNVPDDEWYCPICREEHTAFWEEQWREYHAQCYVNCMQSIW